MVFEVSQRPSYAFPVSKVITIQQQDPVAACRPDSAVAISRFAKPGDGWKHNHLRIQIANH